MGREITLSVSQSVTSNCLQAGLKGSKHILPVGRYRIIDHGRNIPGRKEFIEFVPVNSFENQGILMKYMI